MNNCIDSLRRNKAVSCFAFLLIIFPSCLSAQSPLEQAGRVPITTYLPEDYKGHPQVWTAAQSNDGLMYFGTITGIQEYDGVSWRPLLGDPTLGATRALAKGPSGKIFYAGPSAFGYLKVDTYGVTQTVSLFHLIPKEFQASADIMSIHFLDGYIFLQSRNYLLRLELGDDFTLKSHKAWKTETGFTMTFFDKGTIYLHQLEKGFYKLIGEDLVLMPGTEVLGKERFYVMLPYMEGSQPGHLLGSRNSGFFLFDGQRISKLSTQMDTYLEAGVALYRGQLLKDGNYLLATIGAGVLIMNPKGEIIRRINTGQGLQSDIVYGTYTDGTGGLWILTENGIARADINPAVLTYGKDVGVNSTVRVIRKLEKETYLGTNNGLLRFDSNSRIFQAVPEINTGQIFDLRMDGGDIIVSGMQFSMLRDGKVITLEGAKNGSRPLMILIPKSNPDIMYVGTTAGLSVYTRGLSQHRSWEYAGDIPGIDRQVSFLFETKGGTLLATGSGVLFQVSEPENRAGPPHLKGYRVKSFEFRKDAIFWLVEGEFYVKSSEGMQRLSDAEGKFVSTKDFKAVENRMLDFYEGSFKKVWMVTEDGKILLKRKTDSTFQEDNTPTAILPYLSDVNFLDTDSIIWFGSEKGLVRFDPKKDLQAAKPFFTLLRRIETKTDTLELNQYGRNKDLPALELKDNSLRFEFAAPFFEDEKKTRYQTFLEGFEKDWIEWNENRFKEYTNLSPGKYTFRVRAKSLTGKVSEEAVYSFTVLPPWYTTWWAYLVYALLLGALIAAIVKWRSRKLQAENRMLEERVNQRTAALEKSLTELKATQAQLIQSEKMASLGELTAGIAHEIQNPLNFVNNFAEINNELLDDLSGELQGRRINEADAIARDLRANNEKIVSHGKRADAIVKSMLQHSRSSSGQKEPTDLNALCDEYLRLAYHGLRAKDNTFNATLNTDFDTTMGKVSLIPQDMGRVLLNLINNAFYAVSEKSKTAGPGYEPTVGVTTRREAASIRISIADNGNGIPQQVIDKIFQPFFTTKPTGEGTGLGLSLSYDIVTKGHGGELKVESEEGNGSIFVITLPLDA